MQLRDTAGRPRSRACLVLVLALLAAGCTTKLVAPFDPKLLDGTEQIYKEGAAIIDDGMSVSPRTNADRDATRNPSGHPAHFDQFDRRYAKAITDTEALILRAASSSSEIDAAGLAFQGKIDQLIEAAVPTQCADLAAEFADASLTAKNFVDLKCLFVRWREQHSDAAILKRANWEGRKRSLFDALLAIQQAELSKREALTQ